MTTTLIGANRVSSVVSIVIIIISIAAQSVSTQDATDTNNGQNSHRKILGPLLQQWTRHVGVAASHWADSIQAHRDKTERRLSPACSHALDGLASALRAQELWALKMVDSLGNAGATGSLLWPGLLTGSTLMPGSMEQCLTLHRDLTISKGSVPPAKYCLAEVTLPMDLIPLHEKPYPLNVPLLSSGHAYDQSPANGSLSQYVNNILLPLMATNTRGTLAYGLCAPRECNARDLTLLLQSYLSEMFVVPEHRGEQPVAAGVNVSLQETSCSYSGKPYSVKGRAELIVITALTSLIVLCGLASLVDYVMGDLRTRTRTKSKKVSPGSSTTGVWAGVALDILGAFSVQRNLSKIFTLSWGDDDDAQQQASCASSAAVPAHSTAEMDRLKSRLAFTHGFRVLNGLLFTYVHVTASLSLTRLHLPGHVTRIVTDRHFLLGEMSSEAFFGFVAAGQLDTLFLLSGLLTAVLSWAHLERLVWQPLLTHVSPSRWATRPLMGTVRMALFLPPYLFHRLIRSAPSLLGAVALILMPYPHESLASLGWLVRAACQIFHTVSGLSFLGVGRGPAFSWALERSRARCRAEWWHSLAPLQHFHTKDLVTECIPMRWTVSMDFHLYTLAPLILSVFWYFGRRSRADDSPRTTVTPSWMALSSTRVFLLLMVTFVGWNVWDLHGSELIHSFDIRDSRFPHQFVYMYHTAVVQWTHHLPSYVMGLWLGSELVRYNRRKLQGTAAGRDHLSSSKRPTTSQTANPWMGLITKGMLLSIGVHMYLGQAVVFDALPPDATLRSPAYWARLLLMSSYQLLWPLPLAWLAWMCATGKGGRVNAFLAHPLWQPAARLSFAYFLVHPGAITFLFLSLPQDAAGGIAVSSRVTTMSQFVLAVCLSYACSLLFTLLVELPAAHVIKVVTRQFSAYLLKRKRSNVPPPSAVASDHNQNTLKSHKE